ncbi:unnamed protein product [Ilex paraguariensis]|uniref:Uncharacterized protein n=1 Tax=Ilex paraguariensis TaxID=185542 RepID=A0ABC8RP12_9AQUA
MRNPLSVSPATMSNSKSTPTPCCSKVGMKKGPWTPEEDELLANYVKRREGEGLWRTLPKRAGLLRCGKSCRLRWMNYLRPSVKRGRIAPDEEDLILRLHRLLGNRPNFSGSQPVNGYNLDLDRNPLVDNSHKNLKNSDHLMTNLESGHENSSNEEDDMEFCNGETFSSFLNFLINENEFTDPQHPNVISPSILSQHVTSSMQTFNLGTVWEAAPTSTVAALEDEQEGLD